MTGNVSLGNINVQRDLTLQSTVGNITVIAGSTVTGSGTSDVSYTSANNTDIRLDGTNSLSVVSDSTNTFTGFDSFTFGNTANTNTVTNSASAQIASAGVASQIRGGDVTFSGVDSVNNTGTLNGSAAVTNLFDVTSANTIQNNSMTFNGVTAAIGSGTTDTVRNTAGGASTLTGTAKQVSANGISFTNIENVELTGTINGSGASDNEFVVNAANNLSSNNITFANVTSVDAGVSTNDSVTVTNTGFSLDGVEMITDNGIAFTEVESVSGLTSLNGTAGNDSFTLKNTNLVSFSGIGFSGITNVLAGAGTDTLINSFAGVVSSTGIANQLIGGDVTFNSIEVLTLDNILATLTTKSNEVPFPLLVVPGINANQYLTGSIENLFLGTPKSEALNIDGLESADSF